MYRSRLHFENGRFHLALDANTGEILELSDNLLGENLIKNSMFGAAQPFTVAVRDREGKTSELTAPFSRTALSRPELRAEISTETEDGILLVRVKYGCLTCGDEVRPVRFTYTVRLAEDAIQWDCSLRNGSDDTVTEVRFPVLNGIWFGETGEDNVLYYPHWTGERYPDPIRYFSLPTRTIDWRWQEYRYLYRLEGIFPAGPLQKRNLRGLSNCYPGELCMSWMELDAPGRGLYIGCHDPSVRPCRLEAGTAGPEKPGMCFAVAFEPRIKSSGEWESPDVLTVLHDADWHRGARIYRAFRTPCLPPKKNTPEWLSGNAGLIAHYDFKYQNGGVVHTYRDIPRLADEALKRGLCHILLSGWNRDGFDCGYPMYEPDPDLGSEEELEEGIRKAKEKGVHVTLYMNILIHNRVYDPDTVDAKAVMQEDGTVAQVCYGNSELRFSNMCPQSRQWREQIEALVRRATDVYGADGIYFDQLGCGNNFCFNPDHHHEFDMGTAGYIRILQEVAAEYETTHGKPLCIMGEWTVDVFGPLVDRQLAQTFFTYHTGAFPELYRYTFPHHGVTDMLYPGKNMAMRPVHVAQKSRELMARLYENGSYFWVYDLAEDNTFHRDPEGMKRLDEVITLSTLRQTLLPKARFCDEEGISGISEKLPVKVFESPKAKTRILCVYALEGAAPTTVILSKPFSSATIFTADGRSWSLPRKGNTLQLPAKTSLIVIK